MNNDMLYIVLFGGIFVLAGIITGISESRKKKRCVDPVMAIVIDNKKHHKSSSNGHRTVTYKPVFQYYYNGMTMTETSNTSSNPPKFRVGDETELLVNPNNPREFIAVKDNTASVLSVILTLVGLAVIIVPLFLYFKN